MPLLFQWPPQAYGIWTLVLLALVYLAREWRETRKLSSEDRLARREGYAAQVESLQAENRNLRQDIASLHREYDRSRLQCHEENDQLREQIRRLQDEVAGFKRRLDQQGSSSLRLIEDARSKGARGNGDGAR